jgi:hypothetical protein
MTVLDFPADPADGDIYETFRYNEDRGAWIRIKDPIPAEKFFIGETAPDNPEAGEFWLDSTSGISYVYYIDEDSGQWIQFGVGREGPLGPTGPTGPPGDITASAERPTVGDGSSGDVWIVYS